MARTVNVGSSITLTASFLNATGGAATFNNVIWTATPPQGGGGYVNLAPGAAPGTTATVTGVYPGSVSVTASPDTNQSVKASIVVNVVDASNTPASGTVS